MSVEPVRVETVQERDAREARMVHLANSVERLKSWERQYNHGKAA